MVRRFKEFLKLNPSMKLLLFEAFVYLGMARLLTMMSFSRLAPKLGKHMEESPTTISINKTKLREISRAIKIMSRYTPWESMCLVQAITGMKMLERRKICSTLYLGTAKDEEGQLIAHAWLRCGPYYITGDEVMGKFTAVSKFAKMAGLKQKKLQFK